MPVPITTLGLNRATVVRETYDVLRECFPQRALTLMNALDSDDDVVVEVYKSLRDCYTPLRGAAMLYTLGVKLDVIERAMNVAGDI